MIKNTPSKTDSRTDLLRGAIEHRATWFALLVDEAEKAGLGTEFAHNAIRRCGAFHGANKYPQTSDLKEFSAAFANPDVVGVFEMDVVKDDGQNLDIDFHYCPLVAAWQKLGISEDKLPELCDIAMDGDRGIISVYPDFEFELGKTIAKGDDLCEIRIKKV